LALPIFAITIFVSAFLLFLVQPLVGKLILPKLGGTPQVWNTCMVFFQSVLLLGYAYTHWVSTRLKLRQQLMVHCGLLAIPVVTMLAFPIYAQVKGWSPPPGSNPVFNTLGLLAIIIGVPFFVVSTSAPLLQKWFGYSGHLTAKDPYFLYSVSNIGSLLSLFFYPALIEPFTFLQDQSYIWFGGYVLLAGCVVYCAYTIATLAPSDEQILALELAAATPPPAPEEAPAPVPAVAASTAVKASPSPAIRSIQRKKGYKGPGAKPEVAAEKEHAPIHTPAPVVAKGITAEMTWWRRVRWVLLAAVPSSMMLGITSYVSTDLSPFPLVWIIPLALYLLSFILVYEKGLKWTEKRHRVMGSGYTLHEMMLYVGQPLGILCLCFIILGRKYDPTVVIPIGMLGFFTNALACHGELAEDRPDTKHLTEYFLLMSFGGMLGGLFNGILAPIVFQQGILEFYIVIVVACMIRPQYIPSGWFDETVLNAFPGLRSWAQNQGDEMAKSMGYQPPRTTYLFSLFMDIVFGGFVLGIAYLLKTTRFLPWTFDTLKFSVDWWDAFYALTLIGLPLVLCFFFAGRPLRMGLSVGGLLLALMYFGNTDYRGVLAARRTYFGVLRVQLDKDYPRDAEEEKDLGRPGIRGEDGKLYADNYPFTLLMHSSTHHGQNFLYSEKDNKDLTRLATTYYHRYGPVGIVMERDNWFKGKQNSFQADVRGPTSIVADLIGAGATMGAPWPALLEPLAEPAFATVGLGTGTMVSYARPFQHMTYYEIDDQIREFSLPPDEGDAYYTYLQNAIRRGVNLEVIMGDARLSLGRDSDEAKLGKNLENAHLYWSDFAKFATDNPKAPNRSYAKAKYVTGTRADATNKESFSPYRQKYYKAINVDAFSSDAIPVHLITKQAIAMYLTTLRDDGVLCMHTSNRHMDLVRPVARIVMELNKERKEGEPEIKCIVGKDDGSNRGRRGREGPDYLGHFGSEYVMIYRDVALDKDPETKRMENFGEWIKFLKEKKEEFTKNQKDDTKPADQRMTADGHAPEGWQILNSIVVWFDPYEDQFVTLANGRRYQLHRKVTSDDSLWTDDYSHILGVIRWHWPWQ
jgi:hypothetical protein